MNTPRMNREIERRHWVRWADFIDQVSRPASPDVRQAQCDESASYEGGHSWDYNAGFDGALHLARTGWKDGYKELQTRADSILAHAGGTEFSARLAESGDEVDVGLFLAEEPECMIEYPMEPKRAPVVRFVVSASFVCHVHAEAIYNRGAAILAAIDELESRGIRVEVDLDKSISSGSRFVSRMTIRLKEAGEPVDRDKLAMAICHPATLRRLFFRTHEQHGMDYWRKLGGGSYGMPIDPEPQDGAIVVPAMTGDEGFRNLEQAKDYAVQMIRQAMEQQA